MIWDGQNIINKWSNSIQFGLDDKYHYEYCNTTTDHQLSYLEVLDHPPALELQDVNNVKPYEAVQNELYWKK